MNQSENRTDAGSAEEQNREAMDLLSGRIDASTSCGRDEKSRRENSSETSDTAASASTDAGGQNRK